jgi:hypothetical protein
MQSYQYLGKEYTLIQIEKWAPKVKVVEWEIVTSDLWDKIFLANKFKKIEVNVKIKNDWKDEITLNVKNKK